MAGSAVNLGGMLSSISSNLGKMGNTVGQGLFNPLLDIQKEQRAEEERKRLEAEKIAKLRGMQGDITASNNTLQTATMDASSDGRRVAAARAALQQKAEMNPEMAQAYMAQDAKLAQAEVALQQRGHTKGVNDIDQALANPSLDPAAREALVQRRADLMKTPGVSSAIAAQEKAKRDSQLQKGELQIQEYKLKENKENTQAAGLAQHVISGTDISELKSKAVGVPSTVWQKVDKQVAEWTKAQREAEKYLNSKKDNTATFEGTPYEETYNLLAKARGFEFANEKIGNQISSEATSASREKIAAGVEFDKLTTQQQMEALLKSKSKTTGFMSGMASKDMQEAFGELEPDEQSEIVDYMTETYHAAVQAGKQDAAYDAALAAGATAMGVKMPEKAKQAKPVALNVEDALRQLQELKDLQAKRVNRDR